MLHVKVSEARELGKMWGISRCEKLMVFRAKNAFCHNPPLIQAIAGLKKLFVSYCGSDIWKGKKYKAYILKYKALILK